MDNIVDRLDEAVKLYVTKLTRDSSVKADERWRSSHLQSTLST
jgi:hypothetical protein